MKAKEEIGRLRDLNAEELGQEIDQRKESLFRLRFKLALGEREAAKSLRQEKKTLARARTLLRQKQLAG